MEEKKTITKENSSFYFIAIWWLRDCG